jgi:hypothetical protein
MSPTLCARWGWESRNRTAASSDTLCRPTALQQAFHNPLSLAPAHRKTRHDENHQTRATNPSHPLGYGELRTQDAFDRLDLTFRRGRPTSGTKSFHRHRSEHPLRAPRESARSGFPIRRRSAIPVSPAPRMAPAHRDRCLLPIICSRLVVTCTPRNTPLPSSGALAPPTTAAPPRFAQAG